MVSAQHTVTLSSAALRIAPSALAVSTVRAVTGSAQAHDDKDDTAVHLTKRLYSGFVEHLGRCIYGGLVNDIDAPSPAALLTPLKSKLHANPTGAALAGRDAVRLDVLHELAREMGVEACDWSHLTAAQRQRRPLLRWPGGNFVSNYHWQDGVGALALRPKRSELAWHGIESNRFGTDEFVEYCRMLGVQPYICLNMGTGTLQEALAWLEYCNGTGDTHWARLRRANTGRDEPHNVSFWGLGNEMFGEWQVGHMSADEYTRTAQRWAHALKLVDPTIILVSCGKEGGTAWDYTVLQGLTGYVDMHSIHYYSMLLHQKHMRSDENNDDGDVGDFDAYEKNVFGAATAEAHIHACARLIDVTQMEAYANRPLEGLRDAVAGVTKRPIGICLDEWNVWDDYKATPQRGLEQRYDYTDMLGVVAWLHVLVRNADRVPVACIAQSVNVISPLLTRADSTLRQLTYYPVSLFAEHFSDALLLQHSMHVDVYTGPTYPAWVQQLARPAYVDVVAAIKEGVIHVSVLNRHPTAVWSSPIVIAADEYTVAGVQVTTMHSDDLEAVNTFEAPDTVLPVVTTLSAEQWSAANGVFAVRPHSWSLFTFHS